MECRIYDTNLNVVAIIQSWISLEWYEEYNGTGSFSLELNSRTDVYKTLQLDYYCGITDSDTLMIIKSITAQRNRVIIYGCSAVALLQDRISTADIDGAAYNAETLMRDMVANMTAYPCVSVELAAAGLTDTYSGTLDKGSVYERLEAIAADTDIGFKLTHDSAGGILLFSCYKPTAPTLRYFSEYGNISNPEYTYSNNDYKNVATVEGAGLTVTIGETSVTGAKRKEIYIDATSEEQGEMTTAEYRNKLEGIGFAELAKHIIAEMLSLDIDDPDVSLGEIAECKFAEYDVTATVRITGIEIVSQNNRIERHVTLGTPMIRR